MTKFDITSSTIHLLNLKRVFIGLPTNDENMHMMNFLGIYTFYNIPKFNEEAIRIRLFLSLWWDNVYHCSEIDSMYFVEKKKNLRAFTTLWTIGYLNFIKAFCDLVVRINFMPLVVYRQLWLGYPKMTNETSHGWFHYEEVAKNLMWSFGNGCIIYLSNFFCHPWLWGYHYFRKTISCNWECIDWNWDRKNENLVEQ